MNYKCNDFFLHFQYIAVFPIFSQIKERGFLCRESTGSCDFPEFCSGLSESCGPNIKALDLEPCNNFTSYCYNGECKDPDKQCSKLFGKCNIYLFVRYLI